MSKAKNAKQTEEKKASTGKGQSQTKSRKQKMKKQNISQILSGISLLAIAAYTGWIIVQAPSAAGIEFSQYHTILREQMGIIGSAVYLLMQSLLGNGVLLFPIFFAAAGIVLIGDRPLASTQKMGVVLLCLVILTLLHMNVTYISVRDNLILGLMGTGGGVIGALISMLLLGSIGKVGTYIALLCVTIISCILIAHHTFMKHGGEILDTVQRAFLRCKTAVCNFIFIEVEELEELEESESATSKEQKKAKEKSLASGKKSSIEQLKQIQTEAESALSFRQQLGNNKKAKQTILPHGQQGVMNNLQEIHKALGQQMQEEQPEVRIASGDTLYETIAEDVGAMQPAFYDDVERDQTSVQKTDDSMQRTFITLSTEESCADQVTDAEETDEIGASDTPEQKRKKKVYADELPEFVPLTTEEENAYQYPPIALLDPNPNGSIRKNNAELQSNMERLEKTLHDFGVKGKIADVSCGPAITQYEFQPAAGVKVSKIVNLSDDIALSMAVAGVRIEAPIPGKAAVGIEIPNKSTSMVCLREVVESDVFQNSKSKLTVALGKDISGKPIIADLAKMPHLLIAGSTGSGKSVCMNALINSILYKAKPEEVKFLMVDPKKVELGNYNGIPHLISPVVTDAKKAASALRWAVHEMERRYELFAANGVKDMQRFNALSERRIAEAQTEEEKSGIEIMPYIVVLIDELADLMMVAPADVEDAICRLAQMARAAGMHLVVATQRPSVDVITGIIKANIPSRIAFAVSSQIDSRTILDMGGAEKLLGRGDMLFYPTGLPKPQRVQGVYVSDKEIDRIVEAVKVQGKPVYNEEIVNVEIKSDTVHEEEAETWDELIPEAVKLFIENGQASISLLQRRFRVGYTRAARIVDQMEQRGFVGPYEGSKPRQIKITMAQYHEMIENGEL